MQKNRTCTRARTLHLGLLACALALGAAARAAHPAQGTPVAWVNGQPIQRTTLVELLDLRQAGGGTPATAADRQRALDDIIRMELIAQEAQAEGLTRTPEAASELEFQRDQVLGQRLLRLMAEEIVVDEAELRARHATIPAGQLVDRKTVAPPPFDEARTWLEPQMRLEKVEAQVAAWRQAAEVKVLQPLGDASLADTGGTVATVNGQAISRVKLEQIVKARNGIGNPYDPVDTAQPPRPLAGRESTLEELVTVELLVQQARARQLDDNPSVQAEAELQTKTIAGRMYVRHLISRTPVRAEELKALYRAEVPAVDFKVSQIRVADEAVARALVARLDRGARFAHLAREHAGGSQGWLLNNQMPPEVASMVRRLKPGQHAKQPIATGEDWLVVRLDAVRPTARRPALSEATAWLYPKLMHDKVEARLARLRADARVELAP
ncbi:peptidyl-prolyl cis-trans isomerase [Rhizobacter sp. Root1221]|uniref:peptidyl-prolyl cis-trans isomerase n=1 Tax=Rhizobacter sp. Root1221 TaxID=1736433 RepID=UPI0006F2FCA4|nr:peptidyl-prolyl cis-trans isomerase [Rhizobacter sp. Root1221]KQV93371.1 hypothetical protein ASC87_27065 [Rhizobacter sp. Root1221]